MNRRRQKKLTRRLMSASWSETGTETAALLRAGAPPDEESAGPGAEGTPLCAAASWGHTATVRTLLAHGADPGLPEDHGTGLTPLKWARAGCHDETVAVLLAAGARDDA